MRGGLRYEDFLHQQAMTAAGEPTFEGHSGYFAAPGTDYDPRLFPPGGGRLHPHVRKFILKALYDFWGQRYNQPERWSTVWIAGSGVSRQWGAERGGVGDLDVLIGVNFSKFRKFNPDFVGFPEPMMAAQFNKEMHDELWPSTAEHAFKAGEAPFEVTYYVNPGGEDIRDINPYAAYNVSDDEWTVAPVELPEDWDPYTYFPASWWESARARMEHGRSLVERYHHHARQVGAMQAGTPGWVNASRQLKLAAEQAVDFYEEIHTGRKAAFAGGGKGYFDPHNAIWQYGKQTGVIDALRKISAAHSRAKKSASTEMYGDAMTSADEAMVRAALWGKRR